MDHINSLYVEFWLDLRSREASALRAQEQESRAHCPPAHSLLTQEELLKSDGPVPRVLGPRNEHHIAKRSSIPGSVCGCQEKREMGSREGTWCLCGGIS